MRRILYKNTVDSGPGWKMQDLLGQVKILGLSQEQLEVVKGFQQESDMISYEFKDHSECCIKDGLELGKTGCVEIN